MPQDPASLDLGRLFRDPDMFDSADDWRSAGFEILRDSENKICVASHPSADGYLFKKYVNAGKREEPSDQLANYERRIAGAARIRALIADRRLRHVVAPKKWLFDLPRRFGPGAHILVVERMDLLDEDESERQYRRLDEDGLADLCTVLHSFRGLDSTLKNMPFTAGGQIAFIDTEHWNRHLGKKNGRPLLKYIGESLSSDSLKFARTMWNRLEGGSDFDDEEDTSSSSSSSS